MQKTLPDIPPKLYKAWKALEIHQKKIAQTSIKQHFKNDSDRLDYSWLEWEDFIVDVSKNRLDKTGFDLLIELAKEARLKEAIEAQFTGAKINATEGRAVLHTALRSIKNDPVQVEGENIIPEIKAVQKKMYAFCEEVI